MLAASVIVEIKDREKADEEGNWWPNESDLARWVDGNLADAIQLLDEIAVLVAQGYDRGDLSFDFCERATDGLFQASLDLHLPKLPPVFWQVYNAFDLGTFVPRDVDETEDPIAKYTRPLIRQVLKR